jgi:hypothetical protein
MLDDWLKNYRHVFEFWAAPPTPTKDAQRHMVYVGASTVGERRNHDKTWAKGSGNRFNAPGEGQSNRYQINLKRFKELGLGTAH